MELKHNVKSCKSLSEVLIRIVQIQTLVQVENHLLRVKVRTNEQVLQMLQLTLDRTGMEAQVVAIRAIITGHLQKRQLHIRHHRKAINSRVTMDTKYGRDRALQIKLLCPPLFIIKLNIKLANLKMHISTDLEATVGKESILTSKLILNTALE